MTKITNTNIKKQRERILNEMLKEAVERFSVESLWLQGYENKTDEIHNGAILKVRMIDNKWIKFRLNIKNFSKEIMQIMSEIQLYEEALSESKQWQNAA